MTLREMAVSYREQANVLQERIRLVAKLPARTGRERRLKGERLRMLKAMRREARELAVLCARYYDRNYRRSERYRL